MFKTIVLCVLGYLWSLPVTIVGLLYAALFWALRWYTWQGMHDGAFVWSFNEQRAPWLLKWLWSGWGGHTVGAVIVLCSAPAEVPVILRHEREHMHQTFVLGVFQPIMYGLNLLMLACLRNVKIYHDHPLELDARRAAGQE